LSSSGSFSSFSSSGDHQQLVHLGRGKAGDLQIEAELEGIEFLKFDSQHLCIPAGILCDAVVSKGVGPQLGRVEVVDRNDGHVGHAQQLRGSMAAMTGDDRAFVIDDDRVGEAELADR